MKIFKFVLLFIILVIFFLIALFKDVFFETNLIKTVLPQGIKNSKDIVEIANKNSSLIKIVFSNRIQQKTFLEEINQDFFELYKTNFSAYMNLYIENSANFLSDEDSILIKNKSFDEIYNNAINKLYNPLFIQIVPFEIDPYFLLSDFLMQNNTSINTNKSTITTELRIKNDKGLSPDEINNEISNLIKIQNKLSDKNSPIFIAGSPMHSYYTSKNAKIFINIISILSLIFICCLTHFYFKSIKIILPVIISVSFGILAGFCSVKLMFESFQVVTLVFSTALIGLGIDYSFHYFFNKTDSKNFIKKLSLSLFTTVLPFFALYLSGIELLKQISVFTVSGLIAIYCFVLLFYPYFNILSAKNTIKINKKILSIFLCIISIISFLGYLKLNFNDSLSSLYIPSKKLLEAEKVYEYSTGKENLKMQIISINGDNIEKILEQEENISEKLKKLNIDYISTSKFFPSLKKQKENINLIKELYKNNLNKLSDILTKEQINNLINKNFEPVSAPYINEFMQNENTSLMYVFSDKTLEIENNNVKIINIKKSIENCLKEYRTKLIKIIPAIILSVLIILSIFMGLRKGIMVFLPSLLGMLTSLGITNFILGELNLFSIISLCLVIGFTIDYSIFKSDEEKNSSDAIFSSAITTAFSFGLLSLTSFKLISTIAIVLFFGIIISYSYCILLLKKGS